MLQSNGVLVKSTTTIWEGTSANWPANLQIGSRWSSYAELYRSQLWVNVVIDKRGKAVARLPFKVYERGAAGRVSAALSPFGQLMARPSKSMDPFLFWLWTASTKDIHGEAFWLKDRDRAGRPVDLRPVHPTKVINDVDDDGKLTWAIRLKHGDIIVDRRDLVHFREFNPDTLSRGMSKLEPLRSTLENEAGARAANSAMWRNGGRPSVYLSHPKALTTPVATRLIAQWNDIHSGVDNWAKAALLEEGMTANVMPLNVEELQYIEARKLNREEVCAAYDMAPPVVHILDRATFSNITEQHRSMYRDTMGTVLGSLESTVETELRDGRYGADRQPDFGDAFYGEFLLDEVLRGDFEARQEAYKNADYMTIAEKRERENLPFIEGTEHIFLNSASLPLGPEGLLIQPVEMAATPEQLALPAPPLPPGPLPKSAPPQPTLELASVRSVMGRLSRAKALRDVDAEALVAGLDDDAVTVLGQFVEAQIEGDTVAGFKERLRSLTAEPTSVRELEPAQYNVMIHNYMPEIKAGDVHVAPAAPAEVVVNNAPAEVTVHNIAAPGRTSKRIEHDDAGRIVRVVEED